MNPCAAFEPSPPLPQPPPPLPSQPKTVSHHQPCVLLRTGTACLCRSEQTRGAPAAPAASAPGPGPGTWQPSEPGHRAQPLQAISQHHCYDAAPTMVHLSCNHAHTSATTTAANHHMHAMRTTCPPPPPPPSAASKSQLVLCPTHTGSSQGPGSATWPPATTTQCPLWTSHHSRTPLAPLAPLAMPPSYAPPRFTLQ